MSYQFAQTSAPVRKIKRVEFGILSPQEIVKQSVVKVEHEILYENKEPKVGSLSDVRMGCIDKNMECYTCKETINNCPGHFGHIELHVPVYHIQFIKIVKKILECVCHKCARYRLLPTDHRYKKLLRVKEKFKYAYDQVKSKFVCDYPDCDHKMHPLRRSGVSLYYDEKRPDKRSNRIPLSALEAHNILSRISDETCKLIGLDPVNARPEWMIITVLPVPPPCVRPSISVDTNGKSEDDLTHMLTNIIKYNDLVRKHENTRSGADFKEQLQIHVATYFDNDISGIDQITQKGGRPIKSLSARMKGKDGLIRGHLMGKRVDFSARTVITGDPNISIEEVGIPFSVAKNLTFPEIANHHNIHYLQKLVDNSPEYPGAKFVIRDNGRQVWDLQFSVKKPKVQLGDKIERHLIDGDVILFNRQPTLHKMSMMAHRVKVMPFLTFRLNVNICSSYNADFDGDEMNLHVPQSYETRTELLTLSRVSQLLVSSQANKPVNALVQDALCGIRQITKRDTFLTKKQFYNLVLWLKFSSKDRSTWKAEEFSKREHCYDMNKLPVPAILKPVPLWTGKQLLSMMLPPINMNGYHAVHQNRLDQFKKEKIIKRNGVVKIHEADMDMKDRIDGSNEGSFNDEVDEVYEPIGQSDIDKWLDTNNDDTRVIIENGQLLTGIICKKTAGSAAGSIVHIIWRDFGPEAARDFMDNASQIIVQWMLMVGFSVGLGDTIIDKKITKNISRLVDEQYKKADMVIKLFKDGEGNTLSQGNMTPEETKETKLQDILAKARDSAGSMANLSLNRGNNIKQMVEAGSKGSVLNICQISACVGQQIVDGKRIPYGFSQRTLPHYDKLEDSPESRGFVRNSFIQGLKPQEVFFHAMGGREGLIDTSIKSVTWDTTIIIIENDIAKYVRIGQWIDNHLNVSGDNVRYFPKDKNLELLTLSTPVYIPTCDFSGKVSWGSVTNVTRHDPGDTLYQVQTKSGRKVTVTASKSLLIWDSMLEMFKQKFMVDVKLGDCVPVNAKTPEPPVFHSKISLFYYLRSENGCGEQVSTVHDKTAFQLNYENGFFIGLYLDHGYIHDKTDNDIKTSKIIFTGLNDAASIFLKEFCDRHFFVCQSVNLDSMNDGLEITNGIDDVYFANFLQFLVKFAGNSRSKYVPDVSFTASKEFSKGLLQGYVREDDIKDHQIVKLSYSYKLLEGIAMICSRFGVFVEFIYNDVCDCKDIQSCFHPHSMKICGDFIHVFKKEIYDREDTCLDKQISTNHIKQRDVVLDEIIMIQQIGVENDPKMYDLTVPSTLNFSLSNGLEVVDTAETGYIQRRMIKALEDICVKYDGTVRNSRNDVIQYYYGEDGFDGACIENQTFDTVLLSDSDFFKKYHVEELHDTEWQILNQDRQFLRETLRIPEDKWPLPLNLKRIILQSKGAILPYTGNDEDLTYSYVFETISALRKRLRPSKLKIDLGRKEDTYLHPSNMFGILLQSVFASKQVIHRHRLTKLSFDWAVKHIEENYYRGLIQPGESVGVVAAQSIGEPATQMTLNVFHLSGTGNKAVTTGIPRLKELINAVKNLKTPGMTIYLNDDIRMNREKAKEVKAAIEHCTISHIVDNYEIYYDPNYKDSLLSDDKHWLDIVNSIPDDDMPTTSSLHPWVLRLVFSRKALFERSISMEHIAKRIRASFEKDIFEMHNDDNAETLVMHLRVFKDHEDLDEEQQNPKSLSENRETSRLFLESIKGELIQSVTVTGVPGIEKAFISQKQIIEYDNDGLSTKRKEYVIETDGINMKDVIKVKGVDITRIYCNDPQEMVSMFGIEVARETLMEEIRNVIESGGSYINYRHLCLLCEFMTNRGQIMSITRHGINKSESGPLTKCTFEQVVEVLVDASIFGEQDEIKGVAEHIMIGATAPIGTGMMDLLDVEETTNDYKKRYTDDEDYYENTDFDDYEEQCMDDENLEDTMYNDISTLMRNAIMERLPDKESVYNPLRPSYLRKSEQDFYNG